MIVAYIYVVTVCGDPWLIAPGPILVGALVAGGHVDAWVVDGPSLTMIVAPSEGLWKCECT